MNRPSNIIPLHRGHFTIIEAHKPLRSDNIARILPSRISRAMGDEPEIVDIYRQLEASWSEPAERMQDYGDIPAGVALVERIGDALGSDNAFRCYVSFIAGSFFTLGMAYLWSVVL